VCTDKRISRPEITVGATISQSVPDRWKWKRAAPTPPADSFWNVLVDFEAEYRYANGVRLYYKTDRPYVRFEGSDGWILAEYPKILQADPAAVLDSKIRDDEIHFPFKTDKQDFTDAVKTRGRTLEDAEVAHRAMSICHLTNIAIQVGQRLEWDPAKERFIKSDAANTFLSAPILHPQPGKGDNS
jgi:hypothetical protein